MINAKTLTEARKQAAEFGLKIGRLTTRRISNDYFTDYEVYEDGVEVGGANQHAQNATEAKIDAVEFLVAEHLDRQSYNEVKVESAKSNDEIRKEINVWLQANPEIGMLNGGEFGSFYKFVDGVMIAVNCPIVQTTMCHDLVERVNTNHYG